METIRKTCNRLQTEFSELVYTKSVETKEFENIFLMQVQSDNGEGFKNTSKKKKGTSIGKIRAMQKEVIEVLAKNHRWEDLISLRRCTEKSHKITFKCKLKPVVGGVILVYQYFREWSTQPHELISNVLPFVNV